MGSKSVNELVHETSPFLLEHANDPVEWYAWGEKPFLKAKELDKPVFLSIGYKSCHWCRVMHDESFLNPDIAAMMNHTFINIKVDREELPHIDKVYMDFSQLLTQQGGGWPLNLILTPNKIPFYAFFYLPAETSKGLIGFSEILEELERLWNGADRDLLLEQADQLLKIFSEASKEKSGEILSCEALGNILPKLYEVFDPIFGGWKGEPKFPLTYQILFLLDLAEAFEDQRPLFFAELTLEKMMYGGIFDPILGGFRRYSVDQEWRLPHFEKMLYDNALLLEAYAKTFFESGRFEFRHVAETVAEFLQRELKNDGYFSSLDADCEKEEGGSSLFTFDELKNALSKEELALAIRYYGITPTGNYEGRNLLYLMGPMHPKWLLINQSLIKKMQILSKNKGDNSSDPKVITSWNALLAHSYIRAGLSLSNSNWVKEGEEVIQFLMKQLFKGNHLFHSLCQKTVRYPAGLEDYAYLIRALLTLYESGSQHEALLQAIHLLEIVEEFFGAEVGGFYGTLASEACVLRTIPVLDGAEPSGNGVMAENYLRLYQITFNMHYLKKAEDIFKIGREKMESFPESTTMLLHALLRYHAKWKTVFVVKEESDQNRYHFASPFVVTAEVHKELFPFVDKMEDKVLHNKRTTFYVCSINQCLGPYNEINEVKIPWTCVS